MLSRGHGVLHAWFSVFVVYHKTRKQCRGSFFGIRERVVRSFFGLFSLSSPNPVICDWGASASDPEQHPDASRLPQETLGQLDHSFVVLAADPLEDLTNKWLELRLAPVIARRHLRAARITLTRGLQHRLRGSPVEAGIVPVWKIESPAWIPPLAGVLIYESS